MIGASTPQYDGIGYFVPVRYGDDDEARFHALLHDNPVKRVLYIHKRLLRGVGVGGLEFYIMEILYFSCGAQDDTVTFALGYASQEVKAHIKYGIFKPPIQSVLRYGAELADSDSSVVRLEIDSCIIQ
jgi:hypothetical protein